MPAGCGWDIILLPRDLCDRTAARGHSNNILAQKTILFPILRILEVRSWKILSMITNVKADSYILVVVSTRVPDSATEKIIMGSISILMLDTIIINSAYPYIRTIPSHARSTATTIVSSVVADVQA